MKIVALVLAAISFMPSQAVRRFVHNYWMSRYGQVKKARIAAATLSNGTVLAYVFGDGWCGATGGCHLLILEPNGSSYRVIGSAPVKLPIYVLNSKRYGEPDIGVIYAGSGELYRGGLWYPEGIISFDGHSYPHGVGVPDRFLKVGELQGREIMFWGNRNASTLGVPL